MKTNSKVTSLYLIIYTGRFNKRRNKTNMGRDQVAVLPHGYFMEVESLCLRVMYCIYHNGDSIIRPIHFLPGWLNTATSPSVIIAP